MNSTSSILDFNYETNKGMLFDVRDGQSYPVVKIGKQIWLAENFRYLPSIKEKGDLFDTSYVYENNTDYLDKGYGRLYDWNTANNIAPDGWRLPNNKDFQELISFIIKDNNLSDDDKVGSYLKSLNGWNTSEGIVNTDKYGFNAKPAGIFDPKDNFIANGNLSSFWSISTNDLKKFSYWYLHYSISHFMNLNYNIFEGQEYSVRLIKN
jgi:uncharacterized protein (TIGR02145 family)